MSKNYVYSTLTSGMKYVTYASGGSGVPIPEHHVVIAGGANVADKHLITPRGVVTEVSDKDLEHLLNNPLFKKHMDNGFIIVDTINVDPEVKASDMEQKDDSAPIVPEDYPDENTTKPSASNKRAARLSKGE